MAKESVKAVVFFFVLSMLAAFAGGVYAAQGKGFPVAYFVVNLLFLGGLIVWLSLPDGNRPAALLSAPVRS